MAPLTNLESLSQNLLIPKSISAAGLRSMKLSWKSLVEDELFTS